MPHFKSTECIVELKNPSSLTRTNWTYSPVHTITWKWFASGERLPRYQSDLYPLMLAISMFSCGVNCSSFFGLPSVKILPFYFTFKIFNNKYTLTSVYQLPAHLWCSLQAPLPKQKNWIWKRTSARLNKIFILAK